MVARQKRHRRDPEARPGTVVLEPRPQGKVYRRDDDGSIEYWGEVQVWEPPHRLVLVWQPAAGMSAPTEVEIVFTPEDNGTRLELEHRGWDLLGDQAMAAR
ncbi:MAG TPA: SRPBCC domain-containing protein, partial [Jiangellaceae bacterium]|nr:SRPBCC domain-containing protein [Jiangellaceae bacterium]